MKFSLAAAAAFVSAVTAATLPSAFTLVADGGNTVLTDGGKYQTTYRYLVSMDLESNYPSRIPLCRRKHYHQRDCHL